MPRATPPHCPVCSSPLGRQAGKDPAQTIGALFRIIGEHNICGYYNYIYLLGIINVWNTPVIMTVPLFRLGQLWQFFLSPQIPRSPRSSNRILIFLAPFIFDILLWGRVADYGDWGGGDDADDGDGGGGGGRGQPPPEPPLGKRPRGRQYGGGQTCTGGVEVNGVFCLPIKIVSGKIGVHVFVSEGWGGGTPYLCRTLVAWCPDFIPHLVPNLTNLILTGLIKPVCIFSLSGLRRARKKYTGVERGWGSRYLSAPEFGDERFGVGGLREPGCTMGDGARLYFGI